MSVFQPGYTAVITGGASGIGLALAAKCVAAGMHVFVADNDAAALAVAAKKLSSDSTGTGTGTGTVTTVPVDVSKEADWAVLKAAVGDTIHLLALNAGVGGATPWADTAAFRRILDVNLWGVIHGIAALLPVVQATAALASHPATAIVITGSKQGITNPPGTSPAYNASKAAVRSLAEQLSYDLAKEKEKATTAVHLLVPGWTYTGLTGAPTTSGDDDTDNDSNKKPAGAWWPAQVVDYLVEAMAANKFYVLCPDNDVTEADDRKRVLWSAGDIAEGRAPLSRWRAEYKADVAAWMSR